MSDSHMTASKDSYTVTFHPAFVSRCVVTNGEGECEVYRQSAPHKLNGAAHPAQHTIRLQGGALTRDVLLNVHDPAHAIARITVELYGEGHTPGGRTPAEAAETFTLENNAETCPPICTPTEGPK
jgi:hypothetical protein